MRISSREKVGALARSDDSSVVDVIESAKYFPILSPCSFCVLAFALW